jgi:hypothetical protein
MPGRACGQGPILRPHRPDLLGRVGGPPCVWRFQCKREQERALQTALRVTLAKGSLYIFDRRTMARVELFSHPDVRSAVVCVKISPDGKRVAYAGRAANLVIARLKRSVEERCLYSAPCPALLLCLEWSGGTLYQGYQSGA